MKMEAILEEGGGSAYPYLEPQTEFSSAQNQSENDKSSLISDNLTRIRGIDLSVCNYTYVHWH